ncbi:P-loop containing nucleoside triphosphate hydrolase protein [Agrocybe pediades]|nr:P-loop containing nucleoside triphosphate hydrolase protein [Agrocybe pediades]
MDQWKVYLIGDSGVGKTSLATKFALNFFPLKHEPTYEDVYRVQKVLDVKTTFMEIIDTGCSVGHTALSEYCVRESHAFIIVYSVTSRESFNHVAQYRESITRAVGGTHAMITIVGNKRDLDTEREVSTLEGQRLAKELDCWFAETSARTGDNVAGLYEDGVRYLRRKSAKVQRPMPMEKEHDRKLYQFRED